MSTLFPSSPELRFYDPLAELLGVGEGVFSYRFDDAVKLAGHACPTVAGAFVLVKRACELLYAEALPERGNIAISVEGAVDAGVNGPISQIFTLLTGAAAENGFHGLGGRHGRAGLLRFTPAQGEGPTRFTFERLTNGKRVTLLYDPSVIPPEPAVGELMPVLLDGSANAEQRARFHQAWRSRLEAILADGGLQTVQVVG